MLQNILTWLEPADVYEQAELPNSKRSFRMRLSDIFWNLIKGYVK